MIENVIVFVNTKRQEVDRLCVGNACQDVAVAGHFYVKIASGGVLFSCIAF